MSTMKAHPVNLLSCFVMFACSMIVVSVSSAFVSISSSFPPITRRQQWTSSVQWGCDPMLSSEFRSFSNHKEDVDDLLSVVADRRDVLTSLLGATGGTLLYLSQPEAAFAITSTTTAIDGDDTNNESFASIAQRANIMSKEVDAVRPRKATDSMIRPTNQTAYDFTLPITGVPTPLADIVRQEFTNQQATSLRGKETYRDAKVKAIIVVNIKQDDPVARKTIPELISLAAKYGRGSDYQLAIIACPTDQGYYEPDTSQLLKLKLASEYGYGINPSTVITDKVNLLGTGAVPFWRWLQGTCRTPAGLGRVEGNFEKFLLDGRTGLPVRRYPRKYRALNMVDDIEAVLAGRPLPPAQAGYLEEWRMAAADAERDTYRFEKGLNVFDQ